MFEAQDTLLTTFSDNETTPPNLIPLNEKNQNADATASRSRGTHFRCVEFRFGLRLVKPSFVKIA